MREWRLLFYIYSGAWFTFIFEKYLSTFFFWKKYWSTFIFEKYWSTFFFWKNIGPLLFFEKYWCTFIFEKYSSATNFEKIIDPLFVLGCYFLIGRLQQQNSKLFESRSGRGVQHYVIKFVSDLLQVFSGSSGFLHQ